jgi:hypothetical protein
MEHRCYRAEYCADHEKAHGRCVGKHINAAAGLCDTCARHVERAIADLPTDYTALNLILGKGSTVGGEPVRMTRELPIPLRPHVEALQREMVTETGLWAGSVAAVLNTEWRVAGRVRPGWLLDRACKLLAAAPSVFLALRDEQHVRWEYGHRVLVSRDGLDGALEMLRLRHKARAYLGQTRLVHKLPVPCPRCEAMALEREDGSELIECRECARRYTWSEYETLCLALTDRRLNVA